jgi:hypothetical protein
MKVILSITDEGYPVTDEGYSVTDEGYSECNR